MSCLSSRLCVTSCSRHGHCVSTSSAETATPTRTALSIILCMIYSNQAAVESAYTVSLETSRADVVPSSIASLCVVHSLKRFVGFLLGRKSHKTKTSASIRVAILDNDLGIISRWLYGRRRKPYRLLDLAELLKAFVQCFVRGVPGETPMANPSISVSPRQICKMSSTHPMKSFAIMQSTQTGVRNSLRAKRSLAPQCKTRERSVIPRAHPHKVHRRRKERMAKFEML